MVDLLCCSGLISWDKLRVGDVLSGFVSAILPTSVTVMAAGHVVRVNMSSTERTAFLKQYKDGSACDIQLSW